MRFFYGGHTNVSLEWMGVKVTVFSSLHVQYTMGFVLFLDPQMSFDGKLTRH